MIRRKLTLRRSRAWRDSPWQLGFCDLPESGTRHHLVHNKPWCLGYNLKDGEDVWITKKAYKRCLWLPSWLPSLSSSSPPSPSSSFKYIYRFFILEKTCVNIHIQRCWVGWSSDRLIIHDHHARLIIRSSDHPGRLIIVIIWSSCSSWSSDHLIILIIWSSRSSGHHDYLIKNLFPNE